METVKEAFGAGFNKNEICIQYFGKNYVIKHYKQGGLNDFLDCFKNKDNISIQNGKKQDLGFHKEFLQIPSSQSIKAKLRWNLLKTS